MNKRTGVVILLFMCVWFVPLGTARSGEAVQPGDKGNNGLLEVDSNIAGIHLNLCPKGDYVRKDVKVFFGLIKSIRHVCSSQEIFVGETPLKPTSVPAGTYILLIPSDYVWEREGPVELTVLPGEKTYLLLKLFSTRASRPESNHGGGGGGGGGAGAR
ncbi:MAG: hypothetical protein JRL30_04170 [Deltaproteobacteria bacterium]|nr:hypothetical protein [Deltaproteobacteria bacterium]